MFHVLLWFIGVLCRKNLAVLGGVCRSESPEPWEHIVTVYQPPMPVVSTVSRMVLPHMDVLHISGTKLTMLAPTLMNGSVCTPNRLVHFQALLCKHGFGISIDWVRRRTANSSSSSLNLGLWLFTDGFFVLRDGWRLAVFIPRGSVWSRVKIQYDAAR